MGLRAAGFLSLVVATIAAATGDSESDLVGVYAVIDRVVMEPDTLEPERIQLWGVFRVADDRTLAGYHPARRGYMYYTLNEHNQAAARMEWTDLRRTAGRNVVLTYGSRRTSSGRLRRASEPPGSPDGYPIGVGLAVIPASRGALQVGGGSPTRDSAEYLIARDLRSIPDPLTPADGDTVDPGRVRLVARNVPDTTLRYIFEIESAKGVRERSTVQQRGRDSTAYSPRLALLPGERYSWRVWTISADYTGLPASATFSTRMPPGVEPSSSRAVQPR